MSIERPKTSRPWVTTIVDTRTGMILASTISDREADATTVKLALRVARAAPTAWTDNGPRGSSAG